MHTQLPLELQQAILDQFRRTFEIENAANLQRTVQEVKSHLYNRDFAKAFGEPHYLEAYALRWSASRALCYADILSRLSLIQEARPTALVQPRACRAVCIGGGAGAEIVALASVIRIFDTKMQVTALDVADWSAVLAKLQRTLVEDPHLSEFANEKVRKPNRALLDVGMMDFGFTRRDVLGLVNEELKEMMAGVTLCTIMFTLNELFAASIAKTTALLLQLGEVMETGSNLLVVDSPGSYSEVQLGNDKGTKRYPMKWLLDHALMKVASGKWEKIKESDSTWFRLDDRLTYPIDLENMRYQIHLYRRREA
jgi:25S rRNA (uracil2843-N3)-methyltransferase